jgi:hypothetical protein
VYLYTSSIYIHIDILLYTFIHIQTLKVRGRRRSDANKPKKVPILESVVIAEKMMLDSPPPLNDSTLDNVVVINILVGNECQVSIISPQEKKDESNILEIPSSQFEPLAVVNEGLKRKLDEDHPVESSSSSNLIKSKIEKNSGSGRKGSSQPLLKVYIYIYNYIYIYIYINICIYMYV